MILSHWLALSASTSASRSSAGISFWSDAQRDGDVNRRREHVVGALAHVDVIVGMDRLFLCEAVAARISIARLLIDLVDVHVARGARAGLVNVDRELVVELAGRDFLGRLQQRLDLLVAEAVFPGAGQFSQVAVGDSGGELHQTQGVNQLGGQASPEIGKFSTARCVCAP